MDELVAAAVRAAGRSGHLREEDRRSARDEAALAGPEWLGHPVAVFACADVGLLEVVGLPEAPETSPERAVLGIRPHVRPLLAALQSSSPRLAAEISAEPAALTATGLPACLAAVNVGAAETLAVPFDGLIPGYQCGRCGALGLAADRCPDWGTAAYRCPTSSRRWSAGRSKTAARSWWFRMRRAGSSSGCPAHRAGDKGPHSQDLRR